LCVAGEAVGEVEVVAALRREQLAVHEGVEDELAREAQQVERLRAVLLQEGARRRPVLAQQDLRLVLGAVGGVAVLGRVAVDQLLLARLHARQEDGRQLRAHGRIREGVEPVGRLHEVGVGVVDRPVGVGHGFLRRPGYTIARRSLGRL